MKGFTKFIIENHPDPDGLIDLDSDGNHGRLHTQVCRLAEGYANQRVIEELEKLPKQDVPLGATITISYFDVLTRIKQLKQD